MEQTKQDIVQNTVNNTTDTNITFTHGLLAEDFKQSLLTLVQNHQLDIQTKAIILDSILLATNIAAKQQTQLEIGKYQKKLDNNTTQRETS